MSRNLWNFFLFWLPRRGVAIGFMLLFAQSGQAQTNSLGDTPFQSYYITGGHASAGVRLRGLGQGGWATADINVTIPEDADLLAAFLYWETLEKTTVESSALGHLLDPCSSPTSPPAGCNPASPQYPFTDSPGVSYTSPIPFYGKPLGQNHTAPCWSNGGSTGSSHGAPALRVYRADILRYLRIRHDTSHKVPAIRVQL